MSQASRLFYGLISATLVAAAGLGLPTIQLLRPLVATAGSGVWGMARWCLVLLTGSPEVDEALLLAPAALLLLAALLGVGSLVRQWRATRRLIQAQAAGRLRHAPPRLARLSRRLGLSRRVDVIRSPHPYSFCYGWLRPRVCVSTGLIGLVSEVELEAVLLHERHHLQRHDPLRILLARALGRAFFFVPLIPELSHLYLVAAELAADRAVIASQGQGQALAAVLYKLLTASNRESRGAAVASVSSMTDARIEHLLHPQTTGRLRCSPSAVAISSGVVFAVIALLFAAAVLGAASHVHGLPDSPSSICLV